MIQTLRRKCSLLCSVGVRRWLGSRTDNPRFCPLNEITQHHDAADHAGPSTVRCWEPNVALQSSFTSDSPNEHSRAVGGLQNDGLFDRDLAWLWTTAMNVSLPVETYTFGKRCLSTSNCNKKTTADDRDRARFPQGKPNSTQLQHISMRVADSATQMFWTRLDFSFYRHDMEFDNRILGQKSQGLRSYMDRTSVITMACRARFSYVEMEALRVTPLLEDGTVRLNWRIHYLTHLESLKLWKVAPWDRKSCKENSAWFDGYCIFHVDVKGLVYKVVADRVERDSPPKKLTLLKELVGFRINAGWGNSQLS